MNQTHKAEADWPDPAPTRLRALRGYPSGDLTRIARSAPAPVLIGGLRTVQWPVARILASSVRLIEAGPWRASPVGPAPARPMGVVRVVSVDALRRPDGSEERP